MPIRVLELRSVRGTGGGPEKTILLGAARAARADFDVTVCYLRDARDRQFAIDAWARGLGVNYVEVEERHSFDRNVWSGLRALVRERRIQIVHSHDYKTDVLAWLLRRRDGIVPLATAHGWTGHSARERHVYYPLDKRVLARFPRLIAVSSEIKSELVRCGARSDRVDVILNSIDPVAFRRDRRLEAGARAALGLAPEHVVIGSVGRLEPQKRFDVLLECFALLHRDNPQLRLLIVGEGTQRANLERRSAALGLGDACRLLGLRTDVTSLHHAFDLYVQASDYEGTPNAVLEAMALETPIVATDAGGTREIVRHGVDGLIVPTGDAQALSAAMVEALSDSASTRKRVNSARLRVETDLSFSARTDAMERIYRRLVDGGAS